jgi:hypothetical protein
MCFAACYWAHVSRLVYAATMDDAADVGGFDDRYIYEQIALPEKGRNMAFVHCNDRSGGGGGGGSSGGSGSSSSGGAVAAAAAAAAADDDKKKETNGDDGLLTFEERVSPFRAWNAAAASRVAY